MKDKNRSLTMILGCLLFLFGTASVFYYIWSPLFTAEFQSDTAEMLLWAQQIVEKHTLISSDFSYSYTIPFGGQLILIPFVKLLGVRMISLRGGMSVIALIFLGVFYLFFRELFGKDRAFGAAGILTLLLCGVRSMRELFWAHTVFYSLSVFCWMAVAILLKRIVSGSGRKQWIRIIAVFIISMLACTAGAAMLIYFAVPLLGSVIIWALSAYLPDDPDRKPDSVRLKRAAAVTGVLLAAILIGFLLSLTFKGDPLDDYTDYYTVLASAEDWAENISRLPVRWISLFAEPNEASIPLMSPDGVKMSWFILAAVLVPCLDIAALFFIGKLQPFERFAVIFHWILSLILLFFFCFGTISNYERRLIPAFVTGVVTALIVICCLVRHLSRFRQLGGVLLSAVLVFTAVIDGVNLFAMEPDNSFWYGDGSVMQILLGNGLEYGYSSDFWFANSITVMTGEKVRVREVAADEEGRLVQRKNQTDVNWYTDVPDTDRYFLICQEWFADEHPEYLDRAVSVFRSELTHPVSKKYMGYYVLVFDENIVTGN